MISKDKAIKLIEIYFYVTKMFEKELKYCCTIIFKKNQILIEINCNSNINFGDVKQLTK